MADADDFLRASAAPEEFGFVLFSARRGCMESARRLLNRHYSLLLVLAESQLDPHLPNSVLPADVAECALRQAHREFLQFRGQRRDEFVAWLCGILAQSLTTFLEKETVSATQLARETSLEQRRAAMELQSSRLVFVRVFDLPCKLSRSVTQEAAVLLADQIAALPPELREVIIRHCLQDCSVPQISIKVDASESTVRERLLAATTAVRSALEPYLKSPAVRERF